MNTTLERQQALADLMDALQNNTLGATNDNDNDHDPTTTDIDDLARLVKALERNVADSNPGTHPDKAHNEST